MPTPLPSSSSNLSYAAIAPFWTTGTQTCTSSVVYLNSTSSPVVITKLLAKKIEWDCHIFFTRVGTYTYTYSQLFQQLLVWSVDPGAFGKHGFLGSHVSIGFAHGQWDVHETIYHPALNPNKHTVITRSKTVIRYVVGPGGALIRKGRGRPANFSSVHVIWDHARNSAITAGRFSGGGKKRTYAMMRRSSSASPEHVSQALALAQEEDPESAFAHANSKTWDEFRTSVERLNSAGAMRLVYAPPETLAEVAAAWLGVIGPIQGVEIWTDVAGRASFLFYGGSR